MYSKRLNGPFYSFRNYLKKNFAVRIYFLFLHRYILKIICDLNYK